MAPSALNRANAGKVYVTQTFKIQSFDPVFNATGEFITPGQSFRLNVTDPDAVTDSTAVDSITLRVYSTTDPVGITVSALETGPGTGVFSAIIPTTTGAAPGSVSVKNGDTLTVKYNDRFPADYATRVKQFADPSENFYFIIRVGGPAATLTVPQPQMGAGQLLTQIKSGEQVILSTTVTNGNSAQQPYAVIAEVRDSNNITVYLQWQTGTLPPAGSTGVGMSWTPDTQGTYTIRMFVMTSVANPQVLSATSSSTLTVS